MTRPSSAESPWLGGFTEVLFRAYLDESTDQPETMFTVGGFVGPAEQWDVLEPRWTSTVPKQVGYFHATDCFGGRGNFRGMSVKERTGLLDALTELVVESDIKLLGAGIEVAAYMRWAPKLRQNDFGGNKYVAPFSYAVELACKDYMNRDNPIPIVTDDVCDLFVEDGDWKPSARIAVRNMRDFPHDRWWRDRIGKDNYGKKSSDKVGNADVYPLLQVGDLGAFLAGKVLTNALPGPIPWKPYYERLQLGGRVFLAPIPLKEKALSTLYGIYQLLELEEKGRDIWNEC
jgi:hypothetical protein